MKIFFWNINQNDITIQLEEFTSGYAFDIIILIESILDPNFILSKLNFHNTNYFYCPGNVCKGIQIFTRFSEQLLLPIYETNRLTARKFIIPSQNLELSLIAVHYQSKFRWSDSNQAAHSPELNRSIEKIENIVSHQRTIVLGDFNMNPFEFGMVQTTGIHSTMDKNLAEEKSRIVDGSEYKYFYNPMWSFYGQYGKGNVSGTYYLRKAEPICYFWNIIDQVIIRPELLDYFDEQSLSILTATPSENLLKPNGKINDSISDHLPVSFNLKF